MVVTLVFNFSLSSLTSLPVVCSRTLFFLSSDFIASPPFVIIMIKQFFLNACSLFKSFFHPFFSFYSFFFWGGEGREVGGELVFHKDMVLISKKNCTL